MPENFFVVCLIVSDENKKVTMNVAPDVIFLPEAIKRTIFSKYLALLEN